MRHARHARHAGHENYDLAEHDIEEEFLSGDFLDGMYDEYAFRSIYDHLYDP